MATAPVFRLTEEEYLRLEREAFEKSEFHDGQVFAMSGGSNNHSFLASQALVLIGRQVPKGCRVFNGDLRIKVAGRPNYLYADAGLVCGGAQVTDFHQDTLLNPALIVEVLSPSTEAYDRGKKFEIYRGIPTFCEYVVIAQDRRFVEHHSKQPDGSWLMREHAGSAAQVEIPRWGIKISSPTCTRWRTTWPPTPKRKQRGTDAGTAHPKPVSPPGTGAASHATGNSGRAPPQTDRLVRSPTETNPNPLIQLRYRTPKNRAMRF